MLLNDRLICVLATTTAFLYIKTVYRQRGICLLLTIGVIGISLFTIGLEIDWLIQEAYSLPKGNNSLRSLRDTLIFLFYVVIFIYLDCEKGQKK